MKELKLGIIGAGLRAGVAAYAHQPEKGVRVVGAADIDAAHLDRFKSKYGEDVYTTERYPDLLQQDLDAVFICSPDYLHEEHAAAALEHGLPVYLEKPMAITIEGCDRLLGIAKRTGTKLFLGHNMRYMTIIRKMKKLIDDGRIGEVKSIWCRHFISYGGDAYFRDWHAEQRYSNSLLLQKGAHDLDVMHWLTGAYTQRVSAFGNNAVYHQLPRRAATDPYDVSFDVTHWPPLEQTGFNPDLNVEDQNVMIMEMERGILGTYMQCHFSPDSCRNYTVIGTHGRIENMGDGPESPIMLWNRRTDTYNLIGDEVHRGDPVAAGSHGGSDPTIVQEFIDYVRGDIRTITATPEAARMSVATGCQAAASLRSGGRPLDVPPLPYPT